jgi:hypothetical protein
VAQRKEEERKAALERLRISAEVAETKLAAERLIASATGLRKEVLDLHRPVRHGDGLYCDGCDVGMYAAYNADWPCSTWDLAEPDGTI